MDGGAVDAAHGHEALFEQQRPRLIGIAYRVLGSVVDAEDVVQEAWLRWVVTDLDIIESTEAFLTTVVARLALDRLRRVRSRREVYTGPWLPEPVHAQEDPEAAAELADTLAVALLVVLETLSPLERAAFVLREAFDEPYAAVAEVLGREEPAVRQLVHRARERIADRSPRYRSDPATHAEVVRRFAAACATADLEALLVALAPDVVVVSDGGGVAPAATRPVNGRDKVARLMLGIVSKAPPGLEYGLEVFNGRLGIVARLDGRAISALAFSVREGAVETVHVVANPAKLTALDPTHRVHLR